MPMTAKIAQPCRCLPTIRPNTLVSAAPIEKISTIWTKLVSAFGFSLIRRILTRIQAIATTKPVAADVNIGKVMAPSD
jgi:hypothetical protein